MPKMRITIVDTNPRAKKRKAKKRKAPAKRRAPAKRKRKAAKKRRPMTALQKQYFGGGRRPAKKRKAAKRSRRRSPSIHRSTLTRASQKLVRAWGIEAWDYTHRKQIPEFRYWTGASWSTSRDGARRFASSSAAIAEAKTLMGRVPKGFRALRSVPV